MTDWNAQDYHRQSAQQQKWAVELIRRLDLTGGERILDVGCGDGKVTAQLARSVPRGQAVGLDSSAEMIDFARRGYGDIAQLRFQLGDARCLAFDGEFDWAVSFACLHWVKDHRPVLAGLRRGLKPGGRLLLQFGGKGNAADMVAVVSHIMARPRWAGNFAAFEFPWGFYSPREYAPWMREAGLSASRIELVPKDMAHEGRTGLEGWFRTTWMPYLQRLPEEARGQFLAEILEEYLKAHPLDGEGKAHLGMVRLEVEGFRPA